MPPEQCVFCAIVRGESPATIVYSNGSHTAFLPLNQHAPGHVLFVPNRHLTDATEDPTVTGLMFAHAARYVRDNAMEANILTSVGESAAQTVFHLHVHVVPRGNDDRLPHWWPWNKRENDDVKLELEEKTGALLAVELFADTHLGSANANSIRRVARGEPPFLPATVGLYPPVGDLDR